ncbi:MAG: sigma 54-interacting transcriptional regulator, partial [Deltaproteobacteria bacterium]|nr:sigma 54-interacting transcriptional regulator [Deltaproteobacteria bacterium]
REHNYFFTNVLLRGVIYENLERDKRRAMHDKAAEYLRADSARHAEFLHHVGHGSKEEAAVDALLALGEHYLKGERFSDAVSTLEEAWGRVSGQKDEEMKIETEKQLASCLVSARDYKKAAAHYEHLKEIFDAPPHSANLEERLQVYEKAGDLYSKLDKPQAALKLFEKALTWLKSGEESRVHRMIIENCIANVKMKSGEIPEAEKIFTKNRHEWEGWSASEKKRIINNWLGDLLTLKGELPAALGELKKDLDFFGAIKNRYLMARTHYVMGDIHSRMMTNEEGSQRVEEKDEAITAFEKCLKLAKEIDAYDLMLRAHNGTGNVRYYQEDFARAAEDYERALALARKLEDLQTASAIALNLGNIFKIQKKYTDSYAYFTYAINTLESFPNKNSYNWQHLLKCHIEIAETYRQMKEFPKSEESVAKAEQIIKAQSNLAPLEFYIWLERARIYRASGDEGKLKQALIRAKTLAVEKQEQDELNKFKGEAEAKQEKSSAFKIMKNEKIAASSELETILQINKYLNSEHDPDHLLKMVLNFALELSGAESGLVLLLAESGELEIAASANTQVDPGLKQISKSVAAKAMESGEIIVSGDALSDDRFDSQASVVLNALKSVMCIPLKSRNKTIGVLYLDNRHRANAFENANVKVLNAYCDQVGIALENARLMKKLTDRLEKATGELNEAREKLETSAYLTKYSYDQIIAASKPMQDIFKVLDKVTETNLSIHLQGGSGTGKELIARALHVNNPQRQSRRFVAINCGAIPANLIESELFGYKAGSFTGANRDKKGLFEEANGGTLFLDEVAELELALQVKLLRVLQEGEVQRIGDVKPIKVDVRIVCASHKVLEDLAKQGKFREDLFYRLCQMKIVLPPLSKRTEDIPLLVDHFIEKFRQANQVKEKIKASPVLMKIFFQYTWPGNIRELENVINVACALRNGNILDVSALPPNYGIAQTIKHAAPMADPSAKSVPIDSKNRFDPAKTWEDYETLVIAKCFEANAFKKGETAEMLGISPSTLYKKIKENDLENRENPIYSDLFVYEPGQTLKSYIPRIFGAALKFADDHPYAAIRQLGVSQGYFYKVRATLPVEAAALE